MAYGMHEAKSKKVPKPSFKLREIRLRKADNGGAIAEHHFEPAASGQGIGFREPETFIFKSPSAVAKHVKEHLGMNGDDQDDE